MAPDEVDGFDTDTGAFAERIGSAAGIKGRPALLLAIRHWPGASGRPGVQNGSVVVSHGVPGSQEGLGGGVG